MHLKLVNRESAAVVVTINETYPIEVDPGTDVTLIKWLTQPPTPPLPWTVVVTTASGASQLGQVVVTGPVDQRLTVSEGRLSLEPYDLACEDD